LVLVLYQQGRLNVEQMFLLLTRYDLFNISLTFIDCSDTNNIYFHILNICLVKSTWCFFSWK
jgi:hypothetical protein